jgi:hypothetical protein
MSQHHRTVKDGLKLRGLRQDGLEHVRSTAGATGGQEIVNSRALQPGVGQQQGGPALFLVEKPQKQMGRSKLGFTQRARPRQGALQRADHRRGMFCSHDR